MRVLLLRGVDDPLATQQENVHLHGRLRSEDRSWVTLPHVAHVAHVAHVEDAHAACVDALVGFLRRPRGARRAPVPSRGAANAPQPARAPTAGLN